MDIAAIDLGERAGRDMGDLDRLMADITGSGLRRPITVGPTGRLVLGARRLEACRRLGWQRIDAVPVTHIQEALDRLRDDDADAVCTHPPTIPERVHVDFAMRELKWWPRDGSVRKKTLATGRRDDRCDMMARLLGMNGRQYILARMLVLAAEGWRSDRGARYPLPAEDQERAATALAAVHAPSDLYAAWRLYEAGAPPPPAVPLRGPRKLPVRGQQQAIGSAMGALSGITHGLAGAMPLDPSLPADVIQTWGQQTTQVIRILNQIRRELRRNGYRDHD